MASPPTATPAIPGAYFYHVMIGTGDTKASCPESDDELDPEETESESFEGVNGGRTGNGKLAIRIRPNQPLTVPAPSYATDCPNAVNRKDMWLKLRELFPHAQKVSFLLQLGQLCVEARIRDCQNQACKRIRERMAECAPKCDWTSFRNWVLIAMSCQAAMSHEEKQSIAHTHLVRVASSCSLLLRRCVRIGQGGRYLVRSLDGRKSVGVSFDLAGVAGLIYWAARIQAEAGVGPRGFGRWDRRLLPTHVVMPPIERAVVRIEEMGLCKNRVWNLVDVTDRKEADLPDLIDALEQVMRYQQRGDDDFLFRHRDHETCIPSKCQWSQMDSTKAVQLHKCQGKPDSCRMKTFPVERLEQAIHEGGSTAWSCSDNPTSGQRDPYIAISHVWADGTGVGLQPPGTVNECLFNYFADIAEELNCKAIWWDAISIPAEPKARAKAIQRLHENYSHAHCTVVHDRYLLDFPWDDMGGPCIALVLSTWFTRGWTALELLMSKTVKVLFKNPNPNSRRPLIKDLDEDILAASPASASRGYWLATTIVQRLRQHKVTGAGDLLAVLRCRSTSWVRDRTVIAALLAQVKDCDFSAKESAITEKILSHVGHISVAALLHGKPTIRDFGSFSWCAATLDDMPVDVVADMGGGKPAAQVDINAAGGAVGCWWARPLWRDDITGKRIKPLRDEGAACVKITSALRRWRACLLLRNAKDRGAEDPVLLVIALGVRRADAMLRCRYAGAVLVSPNDGEETASPESDSWDHIWAEIGGRGDDEAARPVHARRALHVLSKFEDEKDGAGEEVEIQAGMPELADYEATPSDDEPFDPMPDPPYPGLPEDSLLPGEESVPRYQQRDSVATEDPAYLESNKGKPEHLLAAMQAANKEVILYLTKLGVELSAEHREILHSGENEEPTYAGCEMLGDVYVEHGRIWDAAEMYELAVNGFGRTTRAGSYAALKAKRALGNAYMRTMEEQRQDDAERLLLDVVEGCGTKNVRKQLDAEIPTGPADAKSGVHQRGIKKKAFTCKYHNHLLRKWHALELNALGDLTILYAGRGDMTKATEAYSRALKKFGTPPPDIEAFSPPSDDSHFVAPPQTLSVNSNYYPHGSPTWAASEPPGNREKWHKKARGLYHRAMKGFERLLPDFRRNPLTLITELNLGINQIFRGRVLERETEDFLTRAYDGLKELLGRGHRMARTAARYLGILSDARRSEPNGHLRPSGLAESSGDWTNPGLQGNKGLQEKIDEEIDKRKKLEKRLQKEKRKQQELEAKLWEEVDKREEVEGSFWDEANMRQNAEKGLWQEMNKRRETEEKAREEADRRREAEESLVAEMKRRQRAEKASWEEMAKWQDAEKAIREEMKKRQEAERKLQEMKNKRRQAEDALRKEEEEAEDENRRREEESGNVANASVNTNMNANTNVDAISNANGSGNANGLPQMTKLPGEAGWICIWSEVTCGENCPFKTEDDGFYYNGNQIMDVGGHPAVVQGVSAVGKVDHQKHPAASSSVLCVLCSAPFGRFTLTTVVTWSCCQVSFSEVEDSAFTWMDVSLPQPGSRPEFTSGVRSCE
ncbi:hypothetical protein MFIFM68171_06521 [Madurella fahalii]|uniref:Heterokaryon incompatibility domain-containing protein n=1 Tax=Madurella fahalii TaxID=1157608 RepID=A0ABQ0GEW2_9PEZI